MGTTKSKIFTDRQNELAQMARVLGHPARIAILEHIVQSNACICNDLVEEIGLAQATISQHLKELKAIGIITGTIEGKKVCYCVDQNRWKEIQKYLTHFFNTVNESNCC